MSFNASTIYPLYSNRVRKVSIGITIGLFIALVIDLTLTQPFINLNILLWLLAFCLICVNFSKLGTGRKQHRLARYTSMKLTLGFIFAFLMGTSIFHIFLNMPWLDLETLFAVLVSNIIFLASHYAFYYFGIEKKGRIGERLD